MTAINQQIISSFEELGMSPEEIAEDQNLDLVSVKAILMQNSFLYRKKCKKGEDDFNFSDEELQAANQTIVSLMRYSEDENLKARLARYIRDDKKGRLDVVKSMTGLNINVLAFNEQIKKAMEIVNKTPKPILVESTTESNG